MAYKISGLFKLERSERGYRIYRLGDTSIGLVAANYGMGSKITSAWEIQFAVIYYYDRTKKIYPSPYDKLEVYRLRGGGWKDFYLKEVRLWLEGNQEAFFDWLFNASFPND